MTQLQKPRHRIECPVEHLHGSSPSTVSVVLRTLLPDIRCPPGHAAISIGALSCVKVREGAKAAVKAPAKR